VSKIFAGYKDVQCVRYLLKPEMYSVTLSCGYQRNIISKVVAETNDFQCLK